MRPPRTSYQKSFKEKSFAQNLPMYSEYLGYRYQRRLLEHQHSHDPFVWEDDSSESSSGSTTVRSENSKKIVGTTQKYKSPQKTNESSKSVTATEVKPRSRKEPKSFQITKNPDLKLPLGKSTQTEQSISATKKRPAVKKSLKTTTYHHFKPPVRPFSAPLGRPLTDNKPFLCFGLGDKHVETGRIHSHNVKSGADVHPSALRAQKRRQAHIQQRTEAQRNIGDFRTRQLTLFNEKMQRETSGWCSEYRSCFNGYDAMQRRHCSSSDPRPRTAN